MNYSARDCWFYVLFNDVSTVQHLYLWSTELGNSGSQLTTALMKWITKPPNNEKEEYLDGDFL